MRWKLMALGTMAGIPLVTSGCSTVVQQAVRNDQEQVAVRNEVKPLSTGKVVETMNSGGYTYVLITDGAQRTWAAVPQTEVAVGEEVTVGYGVNLKNFTSRTLARRFDDILFADGLKRAGEAEEMGEEEADAGEAEENVPSTRQLPASHPHIGMQAAANGAPQEAAPPVADIAGKVVETMDSGGYTYLCVEKEGNRTWAAVPTMPVKVGQEVKLQPGMEMHTFTSKTLQRTFDRIIFSAGPAI